MAKDDHQVLLLLQDGHLDVALECRHRDDAGLEREQKFQIANLSYGSFYVTHHHSKKGRADCSYQRLGMTTRCSSCSRMAILTSPLSAGTEAMLAWKKQQI